MSNARAAVQTRTVDAFIDSWKRLSIEDMLATFTDDLKFIALPAAVLGEKEKTKEHWATEIKPLWAEISDFKVETKSVTVDGESGRAVIHAKTFADLPVGPYRNEHIMILHFSEDGKKIAKLEDFMDSVFIVDMQAKMKEYFKNKAQP